MISGISSTNNYSNLWQARQSGTSSSATENIFSKINTDGDCSVSKDEMNALWRILKGSLGNSDYQAR